MRRLLAVACVVALVAGCSDDGGDVDLVAVAPAIGECFLAPEDGDTSFAVVPCDEPHQAEVVGRVDLATYQSPPERPEGLQIDTSGEVRPDDAGLALAATDACTVPFEDYVGIPFGESRYFLRPILPTADAWRDGRRDAVCVVIKLIAPTVSDGDVGEGVAAVPGTMTSSVRGTAE